MRARSQVGSKFGGVIPFCPTNRISKRTPIVAKSKQWKKLLAICDQVADTTASVFITGATGTGKEVLARYIHDASERRNLPFVAVNCGAVPESMFENEFFGHVKGAFTGAERDTTGLLQGADGGTLFLDEIGEMPLMIQVKLLRVLQERRFRRLGETTERGVDIRLISATNRDVQLLRKEKKLREDLYYRIKVVDMEIPPLCERIPDLEDLIDQFIDEFKREYGRRGFLSGKARQELLAYSWPGNVRELRNVLERAVIVSTHEILSEDLGLPTTTEKNKEDSE